MKKNYLLAIVLAAVTLFSEVSTAGPAGIADGADWNFYWGFDGWGIRDDYTSPPASEPVDDESKRQRGTNLRIHNPTTGQ